MCFTYPNGIKPFFKSRHFLLLRISLRLVFELHFLSQQGGESHVLEQISQDFPDSMPGCSVTWRYQSQG
ncbi:MAG: hypothetical protein DMG37_03850, partial [Acidobacteria bacterium]